MARTKSTKHPETKKPPDKTKKKKKSMDKDIRPKKEQQQKRSATVKRKSEGGMSSPSKKVKRNLQDDKYDDEDWIPCNDSSSQETLEDDEDLSPQKEKSPETSKIKSTDVISKSSKKLKGSARVIEVDEDNFVIIPDVNEGSSESQEEKPEPKPQEQLLRGTRYIRITGNTWKIIMVPGDGNCLFYTLAYLLGRSPKDHRQIRADIVQAAVNLFWEDIRDDVRRVHFSTPDFENKTEEELKQCYSNLMGRDGAYASEIEMKVASMLYPFKICYIQQYVPPNPHDYRVSDVLPDSNKPIKWIRFSSGENYEQGHFEPLDPVGDVEPLSDGGYDDATKKNEKYESCHASTTSEGASELSQKPEDLSTTTTQPTSSYKCLECQDSFEEVSGFFNHYKKKHPKKIEVKGNREAGKCPLCGKVIARKRHVRQHIQSVHATSDSKPFKCLTCEKCFTRKDTLKQHQRTHSKVAERPYACEECGKSFLTKRNLNEHVRTQHFKSDSKEIERPYICEECNKTFKAKRTLRGHLKTHLKVKNYKCDQCGEFLSTKASFKRHLVKHTDDRPFVCELCSKDFKTKAHLHRHYISHSKDRPFTCTMCSLGFKFKQHLDDHERTHLNVKPFKCDKCEKSFLTKTNLRQHHGLAHSENRPFKCSSCFRTYKRKQTLEKHQRFPCATRYPCPHCKNVWFENRANLATHLRVHKAKSCICSTCGKACSDKYRLALHEKAHDKNQRTCYLFPCLYCSLRSRSSDQRELHTFLHHFNAYTKEQQDITTRGHQVIGPTAHKYVLYTVLLVEAKKFPGGTGDDVWMKLCNKPGKYDVMFYSGVYSSLGKVSVRPGHMQPASMRASAVYQQHRKGWRCFGATEITGNYVQMRRREAIYIEWAKSINSKSQVCINKKTEPLPKQEHKHIESLKKSKLNYFCFDKTHCSTSDHGHTVPNTDVKLGLHLCGRLHEMIFNGCGCDTCKYLRRQPNIRGFFKDDSDKKEAAGDEGDRDPDTSDVQDLKDSFLVYCGDVDDGNSDDDDDDNESNVGFTYEQALDPETISEFRESEDDDDWEEIME